MNNRTSPMVNQVKKWCFYSWNQKHSSSGTDSLLTGPVWLFISIYYRAPWLLPDWTGSGIRKEKTCRWGGTKDLTKGLFRLAVNLLQPVTVAVRYSKNRKSSNYSQWPSPHITAWQTLTSTKMPRSFALNDAWHRNQKNEFIWGKIVPDKAQKTSNLSHRGLTKSSSWPGKSSWVETIDHQ